MDFVTPSLFSVLAILAILVYVRLGNLVHIVKETNSLKSKQSSSSDSSNRIRVFVITAKKDSSTGSIIVKHDVSGKSLHSSVISGSVKRVIVNGGSFEVKVGDGNGRDGYILNLKNSDVKPPFPLNADSTATTFDAEFKQYYCMSF
jgi:hypothetical protein